LPFGASEFELTGLTPVASRAVKPMRVAESPVAFECRTVQVIRTNPGGGASGNVVLGEVVHIHLDDSIVNERLHIDPAGLDLVARMGGLGYCRTTDRYEMPMGRDALRMPAP
jgi:flavin reductase (DIM6/NTAB) family NADH-FMN oxidoreductase RutF